MIEGQFIPYSEALLLKQLGFDEPCLSYYKNGEFSDILELVRNSEMEDSNSITEYIAAPLYSQAFKFFREKYDLESHIYSCASGYLFDISDCTGTHKYDSAFDGPNMSGAWDTFEEAELECLRKLIEICKKN